MSSLLDEAIVDAKALREAVLKNAEASLLEAYAPKIEETVARLLEQDPAGGLGLPMDIGAPPADIGAPPGDLGVALEPQDAETGATFTAGQEEELGDIDYAAATELDDDSSLEDDVEIDVTRGELQAMLESITRDIEALEEEMEEDLPPMDEEQVEIDEDILEAFELDEAHCSNRDDDLEEGKDQDGDGDEDFADVQMARMKASGMSDEEAKKKTRKHNESLEITEDNIADIVESLVVDIMPVRAAGLERLSL